MSDRLIAFLFRWRVPLSIAIVAGALAVTPRVEIINIDNDISAWFSRDDPAYRDYDRFRAEFGGTQPLIIAIRSETAASGASPEAGLFTLERLQFIERITDEIERVPSVQRVQSLATTTILRSVPAPEADAVERELEVQPLLEDLSNRSPTDVRDLALNDPLIRGDLISRDGRTTAIIVTFDEDRLHEQRRELLARIHGLVGAALPPGLVAHYNGSIEINESYNSVTRTDTRQFVPPVLALTALAMYVLFRSVSRALVTLLTIVVSVLWALGLYSLLGFGFNILTAMLAPLVIVLAISDDIHLIQHYDHVRRQGSAEHAFKATVAYLFPPLLGASGTTALGLLSLATSDIIAVRQFGIGGAVAVMVDFGVSLVLVPTLLGWTRPSAEAAPHERHFAGPLRRAVDVAIARPRIVAAVSLGIAVAAVAGAVRLRVDTNHISFFAQTHPLSRSAALINRELSGVYSYHVLLEGPPDAMKAPDAVRRIDRLTTEMAQMPNVGKTVSMADYVKRVNLELHDGDPAASVVPDDPLVVAQELFLFALGDEGRRELERVVSSDFSTAQVAVRLPSMNSDQVFEQIDAAERLGDGLFAGTSIRSTVTGSGKLYTTLDHYLVTSQISSLSTAFLTVFATIFLIFRSVRFGLLALVPNLFPVLAVLGAMGWLEISINVATVMLASVALGIVDDDTIHFINRFRYERAGGASTDDALRAAVTFEGRAALTTAAVNSCGFAVLLLSEYKPTAWFGGLLALTMAAAFLAEIFVLPATIKLLARFFSPRPPDAMPAASS